MLTHMSVEALLLQVFTPRHQGGRHTTYEERYDQ